MIKTYGKGVNKTAQIGGVEKNRAILFQLGVVIAFGNEGGPLAQALDAPLPSASNPIFMSPRDQTCVLYIPCYFLPTTHTDYPVILHIYHIFTRFPSL